MKDPDILSLLISWKRSLLIREHVMERQKADPRLLGPTLEKINSDQLQSLDELELILQSISTPFAAYTTDPSGTPVNHQQPDSLTDESVSGGS